MQPVERVHEVHLPGLRPPLENDALEHLDREPFPFEPLGRRVADRVDAAEPLELVQEADAALVADGVAGLGEEAARRGLGAGGQRQEGQEKDKKKGACLRKPLETPDVPSSGAAESPA